MRQKRQVLIIYNDDGSVTIDVPSLPGCVTEADTLEEALVQIREAIDLYIEATIEAGQQVPDDYPKPLEVMAV